GSPLDHYSFPLLAPRGAQRDDDPFELVLALEERRGLGADRLADAADRRARQGTRAMFGGRCQGICPMCGAPLGPTMARSSKTPPEKEQNMSLIQVKVIAGVFTAPQRQEIVERLTEAMVAIEGECMRQRTFCVLEEVPGGHWGVGGELLTADDIKALGRAD